MRIDGRTDMTQIIVAFRNFARAPKTVGNVFIETVSVRSENH